MATNRQLRSALLKKLGVSPQRLHQRVKALKEKYGPMCTADATYVIAYQEGLDLTKFLGAEIVDRVRALVPRGDRDRAEFRAEPKIRKEKRQVTVNIGPAFPKGDAFLSPTMANDAKRMANLYPVYYVLENSLRVVIMRVLENKYGKDWWYSRAPNPAKQRVDERKRDEENKPWHGKRGQHEIFYTDFGHLRSIIERNWEDFKEFFPTRAWITQKLEELETPRNIVAHHNPVSDTDLRRIEVYFKDWTALVKSRRRLIP